MAKHNVQTPDDVQISSMNVQQQIIGDLLAPGPGTPWEDRGSIGPIPAFFKTVVMSMTAPRRLLFAMRRPETASDARVFAIICGVFWGLGWVLQDYLNFRYAHNEFDMASDGEVWLIHFILGVAGTWALLNLIVRLFYKLVSSGEMKVHSPPVLTYNVYAYCLGPSVLALIPYHIGPPLALVWIVGLFMYGATTRVAVKKSGAIICNLIAVIGIVGLAVALFLFLNWLFGWLYG